MQKSILFYSLAQKYVKLFNQPNIFLQKSILFLHFIIVTQPQMPHNNVVQHLFAISMVFGVYIVLAQEPTGMGLYTPPYYQTIPFHTWLTPPRDNR